MIGEIVGSYRIVSKIGQGGMGVVYLAEHTLMGRKAAVKVLRPELSSDKALLDRFFNEARATSSIQHPGIVDVFDYGHHASGRAFIIMEYLEGMSLATRLSRTKPLPLPLPLVIDIVYQTAMVLATTHEKGIIHRDLKPDNIYLIPSKDNPSGLRVKVLDFGVAKLCHDLTGSKLTLPGTLMGSPYYMSPEQCRGLKEIDHRADIYSLGCIMFEMATGHRPYLGDGMGEVIASQMRDPIPSLRTFVPQMAKNFESLVIHCLAKSPDARPQSMEELVTDLSNLNIEVPMSADFVARFSTKRFRMHVSPTPPTAVAEPILPDGPTLPQSPALDKAVFPRTLQPFYWSDPRWWLSVIVAAILLTGLSGIFALVFMRDRAIAQLSGSTSTSPRALQPAAETARVRLKIDSNPAGAEIIRAADHVNIGITPFTRLMPKASGEVVFILRLEGHAETRVALELESDVSTMVTLQPLSQTRPPAFPSEGGQQKPGDK